MGQAESAHLEFKIRRKDATIRHLEVFGLQSIYNSRPAVLGTLLNITERKLVEEEVKSLYRLLITAAN